MKINPYVPALLLGLLACGPAPAEYAYAPKPHPKHQQECSACHMAYPPSLLPAASWARIMGNLGKHYGTDASLDPTTRADIAAWLKAHAGVGRRAQEEPPQDRISKSNWFMQQHDEVAASIWKRASVGSASNCVACHAGAPKGNFSEHEVRIPK